MMTGIPCLSALLLLPLSPYSDPTDESGATPPPAGRASAVSWADFDADGLDDLIVSRDGGTLALPWNRGADGFEEATEAAGLDLYAGVHSVRAHDIDGDEHPDLLFVSEGDVHLLMNRDGAFVDEVGPDGFGIDFFALDAEWIDFDRDGRLDLWVTGARERLLLRKLAGRGFESHALPEGPAVPMLVGGLTGAEPAPLETLLPRTASENGRGRPSAGFGDESRPDGGGGGGGGSLLGGTGQTAGPADPTAPMVTCAASIDDLSSSGCLPASSVPMIGALFPVSDDFFVGANGYLGLNTTNPARRLTIVDNQALFRMHSTNAVSGSVIELINATPSSTLRGGINFHNAAGIRGQFLFTTTNEFRFNSEGATRMKIDGEGDVGIGITPGSRRLYSYQNATSGEAGYFRIASSANSSTALYAHTSGSGYGLRASSSQGSAAGFFEGELHVGDWNLNDRTRVRLGMDAGGAGEITLKNGGQFTTDMVKIEAVEGVGGARIGMRGANLSETLVLDANYSAGKSRVITDVLEIRGGADLVEHFDTGDEDIEPGTVLVIDPDRPGRLMVADLPYDRRVAGVVSGAGGIDPGLSMGQEGLASGDTAVALTGRVFVKATCEAGPIRPGDRLTTSSMKGAAMRVADADQADGAVLGKAMTPLDEGTGLVLVLVNLQ